MVESEIILISDIRICSVPIIENDESIVDLCKQNSISYFVRQDFNPDYTKIRKTIYNKLIIAQNNLPKHLRLCLYEGYRNLKKQNSMFKTRFKQNRMLYKDWSFEEVFYETVKLVSPVFNIDGTLNVPPHSTGGAIDFYLIDYTGNHVDMGIHPEDAALDNDGSIILTNSQLISDTAKKNRELMNDVMISAGFVNYLTEYWHWSYGDRYWAYHKGEDHAIYSSMDQMICNEFIIEE